MKNKLLALSILIERLGINTAPLGFSLIRVRKQSILKQCRFTFILSILPICLSAQYTQSFDSDSMPTDWEIISSRLGDGWLPYIGYGSIAPRTGANFLGLAVPLTGFSHDTYAVSPGILITAGVSDKLTFWSVNASSNYSEKFDIKISTTTPTAGAFTNILAAGIEPPLSWAQNTYDLTPYIGQTIYIAFYSSNIDGEFVGIDDFEVSGNTLSVSKVDVRKASIYPNPVNDVLHIENKNKISEIIIYDLSGKLQKKVNVNAENSNINVNDLPKGIYILRIKEEQTEKSYKFFKA